jgi:uncharacterized protein
MSTIRARLTEDMKTAMKSGEKARLETIRLILAKVKDVDMNARVSGKDVGDGDLLSMMQGMIKQRLESAKIFRDNNRAELADKEEAEIKVIESYMPAQMSDDDVVRAIAGVIAETGAAGVKDMGKVMAAMKEKFAGQMDMAKASALIKQKLAG